MEARVDTAQRIDLERAYAFVRRHGSDAERALADVVTVAAPARTRCRCCAGTSSPTAAGRPSARAIALRSP